MLVTWPVPSEFLTPTVIVLLPAIALVVVQVHVLEVPHAFATTAVPPVSGPVRENWYWYVPLPPVADAVQVTGVPTVTGLGMLGLMEPMTIAVTTCAMVYVTDFVTVPEPSGFLTLTMMVFVPTIEEVVAQFHELELPQPCATT